MKEERQKMKISKGWKFFLAMCWVYLIVWLFSKYYVIQAISDTLGMLGKIIPVFVLVFIFMFFTNLFLKAEQIRKHIGEGSGKKGWVYAMISGILVAGPPYVLFPMLGDLKKKGMKDSLIAVFLYNRNVKIPFIPIMIFYFGAAYTIILSVYIVLFSVLNGIIIGGAKSN